MNSPTERPKVVLIIGASSGIGKAAAIEMRGRGWRVFATVRRREDVVALTQIGRGLIEPLIMDVTDETSVNRAIETIRERAGRLDALVNNAGIAIAGPLEQLTTAEVRDLFEVNVFGLHRVTRAALPMLREAKGRVVNVSSVSGVTVIPFNGAYAASKHAVEAMTDALRMELWGAVRVISIQPGTVDTPIWGKAARVDYSRLTSEHYPAEEIERLRRLLTSEGRDMIPVQAVAVAIGRALELPWPLAKWVMVPGGNPILFHLFRLLPTPLADRLKLRALGWPPRGDDRRPRVPFGQDDR
ncbi:MAG TPA: SDR family oxidoreductase [Ardenticatenaceae bacterium]